SSAKFFWLSDAHCRRAVALSTFRRRPGYESLGNRDLNRLLGVERRTAVVSHADHQRECIADFRRGHRIGRWDGDLSLRIDGEERHRLSQVIYLRLDGVR